MINNLETSMFIILTRLVERSKQNKFSSTRKCFCFEILTAICVCKIISWSNHNAIWDNYTFLFLLHTFTYNDRIIKIPIVIIVKYITKNIIRRYNDMELFNHQCVYIKLNSRIENQLINTCTILTKKIRKDTNMWVPNRNYI